MSSINTESVFAKAKKAISSTKIRKDINKVVPAGAEVIASEAAEKFINVLRKEIESHALSEGAGFSSGGLGSTAIDSLTQLSSSKPYKLSDGSYQIMVWFDDNLSRESLVPERYDGVDNIAALLNSGYEAGHRVYGVWKGHGDARRSSLMNRGGANFIENSVSDFMGNYASDYGVTDIEINDIYK